MKKQNEMIHTLMNHSSTRTYTDQAIDEATKQIILDCAQMAPTSSYLQAYSIIEVTDSQKRESLSAISGGQEWVKKAPLALVFCADLHRSETLLEVADPTVYENTELYTVAVVDASLAAQKALIAAQSMGLGGIIVGGIRNEMDQLATLFDLPEKVMPLFVLCIGYPAEPAITKPRLPQEFVVGKDSYPNPNTSIDAYNQTVSGFFKQVTSGADHYNWVERTSHALDMKPRNEVTDFVNKAGLLKK